MGCSDAMGSSVRPPYTFGGLGPHGAKSGARVARKFAPKCHWLVRGPQKSASPRTLASVAQMFVRFRALTANFGADFRTTLAPELALLRGDPCVDLLRVPNRVDPPNRSQGRTQDSESPRPLVRSVLSFGLIMTKCWPKLADSWPASANFGRTETLPKHAESWPNSDSPAKFDSRSNCWRIF